MPIEDRLRTLLHESAPDTAGVSFDAVARLARRRRRVMTAAGATAVAALVAGVATGLATMPRGVHDQVTSGPPPTSTAVPPSVAFEGITFALPDGWTVAQPHCGPPDNHTVVIGTSTAACPGGPAGASPTTGVGLSPLYGRQFALSSPGHRTTFLGQPAWLAEQATGHVTTVTLSLPWANAVVTAQSGDAATARHLLDKVSAPADDRLEVPADATSVFIQSLAGHDGDGQQRNATVTGAPDVQRLLTDLRALRSVTPPGRACDGSWWPSTALLTVHSSGRDRTYAARFDGCGLVVAGTGAAAHTSAQLLSDIRRLLPNSGL